LRIIRPCSSHRTCAKSSPVQSSPVQSSPVQSSPVQSSRRSEARARAENSARKLPPVRCEQSGQSPDRPTGSIGRGRRRTRPTDTIACKHGCGHAMQCNACGRASQCKTAWNASTQACDYRSTRMQPIKRARASQRASTSFGSALRCSLAVHRM
jgi:hypothetical protein